MLYVAIRSSRGVQAVARAAVRATQQRALSSSSCSFAEAVADNAAKAAGASASSVTAASPKISTIVDQIEKLTLLEAAELVTVLKVSARSVCPFNTVRMC
jgi:large subunit ribosomal protein L7/L12